jgi:hypothetical protein
MTAHKPIHNSSIRKLFKYLDFELEPSEKQSELYDKIKMLSVSYVEKRNKEYDSNARSNRFCFGKYRGRLIESVYFDKEGKKYCDWLLEKDWFCEKFKQNHSFIKALKK